MTPSELILKKRNGEELTSKDLHSLITGYLNNSIKDYQMSAFLMAVWFKGMTDPERSHFTHEMMSSGSTLDLTSIQGIKVDKHSTGGVGDGVSLSLAPLAAACGLTVPMMSGRGLGHTGGTLDKLESIPGFNVFLGPSKVLKQLKKTGAALFGQTGQIAPADRRMYALRDVTGTVDSIDLISASIMSKKLAEGINSLVLDVKTGRGAFMQNQEDALKLALSMIAIGSELGRTVTAFITNMDVPLGNTVGNSLEMISHIELLKGNGPEDLVRLVTVLGGEMIRLAGKADTVDEGENMIQKAVSSGTGLNKLIELIEAQGGDPHVVEDYSLFTSPVCHEEIRSASDGILMDMNPLLIGKASVLLGAGRLQTDDKIDPAAGFRLHKKPGQAVQAGEKIADAYAADRKRLSEGTTLFRESVTISEGEKFKPGDLIIKKVSHSG